MGARLGKVGVRVNGERTGMSEYTLCSKLEKKRKIKYEDIAKTSDPLQIEVTGSFHFSTILCKPTF